MRASFSNISVAGIAAALPAQSLNLKTLSGLSENEIKRIIISTGIEAVRVAPPDVKASDLCVAAALELFAQLKIDPQAIDAIVFISQTPDYVAPATSVVLQHRLGLSKNIVAFDINYGCSGYIYGLYQAAMLISSGGCQRVLVCAGDVITSLIKDEEYQMRMVLGDAGSATLLEGKNGHALSVLLKTDGSGCEYLIAGRTFPGGGHDASPLLDGYYHMDGAKVMEFALREVPPIIEELLEIEGWKKDEVGVFVLHQANQFMLDYLRKKLKLPVDAVPIAVRHIGNTGPASIPVVLAAQSERLQKEKRLKKVVLCGFGVGLSWGAIGLSLEHAKILPLLEV